MGAAEARPWAFPAPWGSPAILRGYRDAADGRWPRPRRGRGRAEGGLGEDIWKRLCRRACPTKFTAEAGRVARDDMPITVPDGDGAGEVMVSDLGAHAADLRGAARRRARPRCGGGPDRRRGTARRAARSRGGPRRPPSRTRSCSSSVLSRCSRPREDLIGGVFTVVAAPVTTTALRRCPFAKLGLFTMTAAKAAASRAPKGAHGLETRVQKIPVWFGGGGRPAKAASYLYRSRVALPHVLQFTYRQKVREKSTRQS